MLLQRETQHSLNEFLQQIKLLNKNCEAGKDKTAKIEQIISYMEVIYAQLRKYSKKRELVFIDCGAGNCYLSFLVYYFYTKIDCRRIKIHCLDTNQRLMEKNSQLAQKLRFKDMFFHACDIGDYTHSGRPDMVYSLHACDSATDKTLFLGLETKAKHILSVSCCQHTIKKRMRSQPYTGLTRHRVFKERLAYMVGDSLRALLLETEGYKVDIIEFVSSRSTNKNIMLRAQKGYANNPKRLKDEYQILQRAYRVTPALERYICQKKSILNLFDENMLTK